MKKDGQINRESYTMIMDQEKLLLSVHPTHGTHIQCNPYQNINANDIFHRTGTNNHKICVELQKTPNSSSNLDKEE